MSLDSTSEIDRAKIRRLPWHLAHVSLTNIFFLWTFGGSVFLLFLSELGLPKGQIGIVLSFFPFAGLVALFFAPAAARLGRKRVYITCFTSRYFVIISLLFLPWVMARAGHSAGVALVVGIMLTVAVLRALGETAYYPWMQEFVPNAVRGRYSAVNNAFGTLASALALVAAGWVVGSGSGLGRYLWLLGVGSVIGLSGILVMLKVEGGAPERAAPQQSHFRSMLAALRDPNLSAYLWGMGGIMLGSVLMTSFLPLYLKEQIGLAEGTVVTLDTVVMVGGALSSIAWGWAADRLGSRPVLMLSLAGGLLLPLLWLFLPRQNGSPALWAGLLYFAYGALSSGSSIGAGRLLYNRVVPPEKSTAYMALYYAWMGLTGGAAPLLAGALLSASGDWRVSAGGWIVDGYSLVFGLGFALLLFGLLQYARVTPDGLYTTRALLRKILPG